MKRFAVVLLSLLVSGGCVFSKTLTYNQMDTVNMRGRGIPADERATNILIATDNVVYGATSGDKCHVFRFDPKTSELEVLATIDGPNTVGRGMVLDGDTIYVGTMLTKRQVWWRARKEGRTYELDDANLIPIRETDKPFMMPIEDVFTIKGRGTVVTGRIERGTINTGDPVEIVGMQEEIIETVVTGVEMFHKILDEGRAGDNVGLLLRGTDRDEVERGMVIAKPKSIKPITKFRTEVYVLKQEEGGRHKPFFTGYRPQFYIKTIDVTGTVTLPEGVEMVMPGDLSLIHI